MNERDMFDLILDQPEPDLPSVVDAAVTGGRRARRRRRFAVLASMAGVVVIAGIGVIPMLDRTAKEPVAPVAPGSPPLVRTVPATELPASPLPLPAAEEATPRGTPTGATVPPEPGSATGTPLPTTARSDARDPRSSCAPPESSAVCEAETSR